MTLSKSQTNRADRNAAKSSSAMASTAKPRDRPDRCPIRGSARGGHGTEQGEALWRVR